MSVYTGMHFLCLINGNGDMALVGGDITINSIEYDYGREFIGEACLLILCELHRIT